MNISLSFIRVFFVFLSILFMSAYSINLSTNGVYLPNLLMGAASGLIFGVFLVCIDVFLKGFSLKSFNIAILGLILGYVMGQLLMLIFSTALDLNLVTLSSQSVALIRVVVFLITIYMGLMITVRGADELHVSIPFVKFKPTNLKKKDIVIDASTLMDSRIIDLATSGLLDHHLILPRFVTRELQSQAEGTDEVLKTKARRCLEVIKKLESIPLLDLRYSDTDFLELKDSLSKLIHLARLLDANIMTADMNRIQQSSHEGIRIINIHMLSNALKPLTQSGEFLNIKIQRYGKEARQGIGYLDDGTMVVVNGGAEFIGEAIKTQVLSVKHTSSGRMIFCNAAEGSFLADQELTQSGASFNSDESSKSYFTF